MFFFLNLHLIQKDYTPTVQIVFSCENPGHNCPHDGSGPGEVKSAEQGCLSIWMSQWQVSS